METDAARLIKDQVRGLEAKAVKAKPEADALALIEAQAGGALVAAETEPIPSKVAAEAKAAADTSPTPLSPASQRPASTVTLRATNGAVVARYTREAEGGTARAPSLKERLAKLKELKEVKEVKEELKQVKEELKEVLQELKEVKEVLKVEALLKEKPKDPTLGQLKEVRDLCENQAENGSFPTLAALIAGFSLGVLPTLKYYDVQDNGVQTLKYYTVQDDPRPGRLLGIREVSDGESAETFASSATHVCNTCPGINHTVLAHTQVILLGLTGILSAVSMVGFFLVFWKGRKTLSSLAYLVEEEGSTGTWKDMVRKTDWMGEWNPPSEIYIIKNQIYNFLEFSARCDVAQKILRVAFWLSLITLMLSSAVSPHLYCFNCNLGICISTLMLVGCLTVVIVVLLPVFNGTTKAHAEFGCARPRVSAAQSSSGTVAGAGK